MIASIPELTPSTSLIFPSTVSYFLLSSETLLLMRLYNAKLPPSNPLAYPPGFDGLRRSREELLQLTGSNIGALANEIGLRAVPSRETRLRPSNEIRF